MIEPRLRLLDLQQHVNQLGIAHVHRPTLPLQNLERLPRRRAAPSTRRAALRPEPLDERRAPIDDLVLVFPRHLVHDRVHVVRLGPAELVRAVANLGPDLVREERGERLIAARRRGRGELVQEEPRHRELDQPVLEFVSEAEEAAVQDEGVHERLEEVFDGQSGGGEEALAVREELGGPVDGAAEATGCGVSECGGLLSVGWVKGEGVEFLGVCPCTLGFE